MSRPGWNGRRVTNALNHLYRTTHPPTCWLCHHHITRASASIDHILPASTHSQLEWDPHNWQLAHLTQAGTPTGCPVPDCQCIGNKRRRDQAVTAPSSREW
jgi:hypothetical protein